MVDLTLTMLLRYIKEFVHGDFGRTQPNMSTITGVECDILQLDVKVMLASAPSGIHKCTVWIRVGIISYLINYAAVLILFVY